MDYTDFHPKPGEFYQNDQGKLFQIITIAHVPDTDEEMLVYQALQADFKVYVRPLSGFPFQPCQVLKDGAFEGAGKASEEEPEAAAVHPLTVDFLDARTNEEKLNILIDGKGRLTARILDDIAVSLDLQLDGRDVAEGYEYLKSHLEALIRFEGSRLR